MQKYEALKAVAIVVIATCCGRILGFVRELVIAARYGTEAENDALIVALSLPDIILGIIAVALSTTLIPIYIEARNKRGESLGQNFISALLIIVVCLTILISLLAYFKAFSIIDVLASSLPEETKLISAKLFIILIPITLLTSVISIFGGYLQANALFFIPAFISIPLNLAVVSSTLFLDEEIGIYAVAWGYLIGTLLQFLIVCLFVLKKGFHFTLNISEAQSLLKQAVILLIPVLIGSSVLQLNVLARNYLAAGLPEGSISALYFADKLMLFPHSVFILSLSVVAFPSLAEAVALNNQEEFIDSLKKWVNILLLLVMPLTIAFVVLNTPIVQLVYEHGSFDSRSTVLTSQTLQFYALALPAYGLRELLSRAFYSLKDTRTPMINGVIGVAVNIILSYCLVGKMQHRGLALAAALSATITVVLLFNDLEKKGIQLINLELVKNFIKYSGYSAVMGVTVYLFYRYVGGVSFYSEEIGLLLCIFLGCALYFAAVAILSPEIAGVQIGRLKEIIRLQTNKSHITEPKDESSNEH
ncbi:MAG: murein biosynthesis integral membrane protein MurJ [Desulfotomaculaceae bacterium]|nr:murein biosynthesis integral membrane protein MurJ [Desulfotomaculaceae bacterium]